ncbi:class I lanthipeptide [Dyadobacter sp. LJ53]|uniref:class I lanthipeptide n=1 Tax=Dyadobacter chenwenxiniae TaxID=2906456 RepID=UPI001F174B64|nr:class I lanthipeptide [Dyadobacter chenwenxiniae]MCF0052417.1 class I lanthipeptide [Dyadobacter chenwenxiniae]
MKKKKLNSKLSVDKETIANLNLEHLSSEKTELIQGGAGTAFTNGASCCHTNGSSYTSCC